MNWHAVKNKIKIPPYLECSRLHLKHTGSLSMHASTKGCHEYLLGNIFRNVMAAIHVVSHSVCGKEEGVVSRGSCFSATSLYQVAMVLIE